ncbi:gamma-glutamyltranspeptidase 1-like protein [Labeo rohita]|uniref:Glutathione hydrolase n=1 Tax=Labeo rohita TaxID=84645 RepID=A0A498NAW8_LABRO|nr:gamma-glutamyltranspeptidase 1-like protein [Labeo rohita]
MGCLTYKRCLAAIVFVVILKGIIRLSDKCYTKAAVAADAGTCSEIGRDILKRKGSAVDAAIAALLCVSLFNAQSMGIGGGAVFTIYNASTGKVETINARETAPLGASENMFGKDPEKAKPGGIITHEDLWGYKPVLNEYALNFTVGKYIFHAPDAPFGGPVLALILNILKGYNISSSSVSTTENKILTYHRMIEAFRFANVQKGKLGDPLYENVTEVILNYLFFGYDLQKAVKEPRVQITINETDIEEGFDKLVNSDFKMSLCEKSEDQDSITRSSSPESSCNPPMKNMSSTISDESVTSNLRDILKRNGSAVDAAIAALLCVSLFNAQSVGIGGGGVFTIYNASTGKVETINARETAPMSASQDMFGKDPEKAKPGLFIAVPGELRGYELAHKRHGRLQWKELFEPSIKLAREGFHIGKALAKAINETSDTILTNAALCEVFCDFNNNPLKYNDTLRFPKLAETYEKIAEEGPDAFYDGSLTQDILDDIKAAGGIITREDLKRYKPVLNEHALNFTVGKYIFHAPDAPFGGPVLALILNILKGYNFSSSSVSTTENKTLTYHRMIEAFRFADAQKSKLGDPLYEDLAEIVKIMTSESLADKIRSKIKDDIKQTSYFEQEDSNGVPDDHGTSHLSVLAEDGSAVAVTSSINN